MVLIMIRIIGNFTVLGGKRNEALILPINDSISASLDVAQVLY